MIPRVLATVAATSSLPALALAALLLVAPARAALADDRATCIDGDDAVAVPACQRVVAANPSDFSALMALGDALVRLNRHGEASEAYHQAVSLEPANEHAAQKLRLARSNLKEADFLRQRDAAPAGADAGHATALDRIRCTRMSGDAALAACERALRAAPGDTDLLAARARLAGVTQVAALRTTGEPGSVAATTTPPPEALAERLSALKRLRDADVITDDEYASRRAQVLNAITGLPPVARAERVAPAATPTSDVMSRYADIEFGRYHALVIGMDGYRHLPALETAVNDARAVAEVLQQQYGFEVNLLTDASRGDIIEALDTYRATLGDRDNLLIYYAGHGWLDEDAQQGFWLPVDARRDSRVNWISNDSIRDAARAMRAKHVLVVADSCFSGTLTRSVRIPNRTADYLRRMASKRARLALSSGGLEPVADATDDGRHSPFARSFIEALRGNDSVIDGTELFSQLRHPVMINADQTPEYADIRRAGHDGGDFLFVRR